MIFMLMKRAGPYLLQSQQSIDLPPVFFKGKLMAHLTNLSQEEEQNNY